MYYCTGITWGPESIDPLGLLDFEARPGWFAAPGQAIAAESREDLLLEHERFISCQRIRLRRRGVVGPPALEFYAQAHEELRDLRLVGYER